MEEMILSLEGLTIQEKSNSKDLFLKESRKEDSKRSSQKIEILEL